MLIIDNTGRKDLVYLMKYPILYRIIFYYNTISRGNYIRLLIKI